MAFYILSALFVDNFVIIFVITVLLAALDFWVVKNVSGRILVGLRWWNEINDLGESVWKFESLDQEVSTNINLWTRKITLGIAYHFLNCYMKILLGKGKTFCFFLSNFVICCIVIGTLEQGLMAVFELEFYSK